MFVIMLISQLVVIFTVLMDKLRTCCDGWDQEVTNVFVNILVLTQGMVLILYGTEKVAIEQWQGLAFSWERYCICGQYSWSLSCFQPCI